MSKASQPIELQRLTEERCNNGGMSVPDPSSTEIGGVGPMYTSVEDAQSATQDFKTRRVARETSQEYTLPGLPEPPNEYDIITDKQREATAPGFTLQQENILYADSNAAQEMKHQTLTMERIGKQKYSGRTSPSDLDEPKERCCTCKTKDCCVWFVISCVLLLAVAAIVLIVMVIVGVVPVCTCAASPEEVQNLRNMVAALSNRQTDINEMVNRLNSTQTNTSSNIDTLTVRLDSFDVTPQVESAIAERITESGTIIGVNYSAILRDFEPFSDCVTNIERTCSVPDGNRCETTDTEYIATNEFNYTRDVQCVRLPGSTESNPIVTTLVIESNIVFCLCDRVVVNSNPKRFVECGIQITRCRLSRNVPVDIITTATRTGN